jgi:hypothetical protein
VVLGGDRGYGNENEEQAHAELKFHGRVIPYRIFATGLTIALSSSWALSSSARIRFRSISRATHAAPTAQATVKMSSDRRLN